MMLCLSLDHTVPASEPPPSVSSALVALSLADPLKLSSAVDPVNPFEKSMVGSCAPVFFAMAVE